MSASSEKHKKLNYNKVDVGKHSVSETEQSEVPLKLTTILTFLVYVLSE